MLILVSSLPRRRGRVATPPLVVKGCHICQGGENNFNSKRAFNRTKSVHVCNLKRIFIQPPPQAPIKGNDIFIACKTQFIVIFFHFRLLGHKNIGKLGKKWERYRIRQGSPKWRWYKSLRVFRS